MSAVRQIGIQILVNAQSVMTELTRAQREFGGLGSSAEQASARATRGLSQVRLSLGDIVTGAAGLHVVGSAIQGITNAITAMPRNAFNFSSNLEVSQVGMAGILGSMTAINGQQTEYHQALRISSDMIRQLNDDALRTAATSQELTTVFQALLAPGLSARMTLDEIRQLTVVGTNAVKSMGLESTQVVQELRDLVAGGITPASSTLATALGLKDSDIAKARASSEGLFAFLMERMKGFEASSEAFGETFKGKLDQLKEGATRVAAEGMEPLIAASKQAVGELGSLFVTIDANKNVTLNTELVAGIKEYATTAAQAMAVGKEWAGALWENRDAAIALGAVWAGIKLGNMVAQTMAVVAAKVELAQTSRLAAMQAAAEAAGNVDVVATTRQKIAAYLAELEAKVASARADVAAQAAQIATLTTTREAIVLSRAEVVAKLDATRATMAQAEAQIVAARAAGAQSMSIALLREGTQALAAAQARHALLMSELAILGRQQAGVNAAIATSTAAATAATTAATAATGSLAAAHGAASVAGRALGGVLGFVGGPIGLVTTALMLGVTAWSLWGSSGSDAERKVQGAVERTTPEIIADLDRQIEKLNQRNALAASGPADLAKRGGADVEALAALKQKIDRATANTAGQLSQSYQKSLVAKLQGEYNTLEGKIRQADAAQQKLTGNAVTGAGQLTLTLTGSEQAWRKANDGVKTATAAQQEYESKLSASRQAWETFKTALGASGANDATIAARQTEQNQVEKALADERDKKIKEGGASAATAQSHAIDAQIAATKQGYKLLAAQTADGLDEIDSLRKQDLLSESEAMERRTELQLQDMDAQRAALQTELALLKGKKDSAKKQANLLGELAELEQKRANVQNKSDRDMREQDGQVLNALEQRIDTARAAAAQAQESVRVARLETLEIGKTGAALGALRQARVEETASQLEAQARTQDGIDLSGEADKALRAQAKDVRDLAKVSGYNESARMVSDYAKAIDEANAATRYEQSLAGMSRRDRDIALEQYRIAIDLEKRLAEIRLKNPDDAKAAAQLEAQAREAAARAQAGAAAQVNLAEWNQSVQQYDDVFRKGFADMVNGGKGVWESFTQSLATTFKTTVADQLYKTFAQPIVVQVIGNVLGLTGLGGSAASAAASGSSFLGLAGNASSLYSAATGNGIIGNAISTVGGWLGFGGAAASGLGLTAAAGAGTTLAATGTGLGMSLGGAGLGMTAGSAGVGAIGAGIGTSAAAGGTGAAAASSFGSMAAAAGPWIAAGLALYAIVSSFDDSGTYHTGGAGSYSASGGTATGLKVLDQGLTFGVGAEHYSKEAEQAAVGISQGIVQMLDQTAKSFGRDAGYYAATAFADDSSKDGAWGSLAIKLGDKVLLDWKDTQTSRWAPREFADGAEGQKQYTAALVSGVRDVLKSTIGDVSWAQDIVDKLGDAPTLDALSGAVQQINAVNAAFDLMGQTLGGFGGITDEMKSALIAASGGIDALAANAGSFYENFYTDAERLQRATASLTDEFAKAGHAMPATEAAYRKLLEEQLKAGTGSAALAAQLLTLAPAFAQVAAQQKAAVEAAGISGAKIADTLRDAMLGRMDASGAGAQIAGMVTDGIYNALAGGLAAQLSDMMMSSLITPVVQAAIAGTSVSEAVSRGAIDNMIESARAAAEALEQVFSDAQFLSAIESIGDAISGVVAGAAGLRGASTSAADSTGGAGSGSGLFAIGGSAVNNGYQAGQALSGLTALTEQTLDSNRKVSDLLQKLLTPEKIFANRYKELDHQLEQKRQDLSRTNVGGGLGVHGSTLQADIDALRAQIADTSAVNAVVDPLLSVLNRMATDYATTQDGAISEGIFDQLADLVIERGRVNADAGTMGPGYALGGAANWSIADRVQETLQNTFLAASWEGKFDWFDTYINDVLGITSESWKLDLDLQNKITQLGALENGLREWYIAQSRVIAVEDMTSLASEAEQARAKAAALRRTGGLEDPVTALKDSLATKMLAIDEGIGAALFEEVQRLNAQKPDDRVVQSMQSGLSQKNQLFERLSGDTTSWRQQLERDIQNDTNFLSDASGWGTADIAAGVWDRRAANKALLQSLQDGSLLNNTATEIAAIEQQIADAVLAATDPAKRQALLDEIATYKGGITEWYEAQAQLLSTEMLVDINRQITALEAPQTGPLTAIKTAIEKYLHDLADLGTLDADAQTAIDKLAGLQLSQARKDLYDQLLTQEDLKERNSADLAAKFAGVGAAVPATTEALRQMIDAARAVGNTTLADTLLELVPAFVALQGVAGGLAGSLQSATDDAFAALQRAVDIQRDVLGEKIGHLQAVFDQAGSAANHLYGEVESASAQAGAAGRAFIDQALANAQASGYMPDADDLSDAIDGVRKGIAQQQYASTFESERDRLVLAGKLTELKDIAGPQLTEAQRQLKVLDETLAAARTQIDELRGINTSVLSFADAMKELAAAIAAEKAAVAPAGGGGGGGYVSSPINSNGSHTGIGDSGYRLDGNTLYFPGGGSHTVAGDGGAQILLDTYGLQQGGLNGTLVRTRAMGGYTPPGMTLVGEEGPELVNFQAPSMIYTAAQTSQLMRGSSNTERLESLVQALTAEVQHLRSVVAEGNRNTANLLEITDQKSEGGNADRVELMNVGELAKAIAKELEVTP